MEKNRLSEEEKSKARGLHSSEIMTVWEDGKGDFEIPRFCPHCGVEMEEKDDERE